jgi:hypothetical protein
MSFREFEATITAEARGVLCNSKLRVKDLREWSTGEIQPEEGEFVIQLPRAGVYAAYKDECDKRPKQK